MKDSDDEASSSGYRNVVIREILPSEDGCELSDGELSQSVRGFACESMSKTRTSLQEAGWVAQGRRATSEGLSFDAWQKEGVDGSLAVLEKIQWVMWADIEGFSHLYASGRKPEALRALRNLVSCLETLMRNGLSNPAALYVHQVGDGFVVCEQSDNLDTDLSRPISIAIFLLRCALLQGSCLKVGIGLGEITDIQGVYPRRIVDQIDGDCLSVGGGTMTLFPIMGDGLVDSHSVCARASGPLLLLRRDLTDAVPGDSLRIREYKEHAEIDWIHADLPDVNKLLRNCQLSCSTQNLETALREYVMRNSTVSDAWRKGAQLLIQGYT